MNSVTGHIDIKLKVLTILRGDYGNIELKIDNSWNVEITDDIFKVEGMSPINIYEREIAELLSSEEELILYNRWGTSLSIMIGTTASLVGISKSLAKDIIIRGDRYGILYQANNYVWKIKDPEIVKSRWLDKAKQLTQGPKIEKESITETIKRSLKEGVGSKAGGQIESGMHSSSSGSNDGSSGGVGGVVKRKVKQPTEEQEQAPIEIIPGEPIKRVVVNVEALREQLTKLQEQYDDPDFVEGVTEDRGTLRDKIKRLRVQITNAEIEETKNYFKGTKMTPSGSIMNITEEYNKKGKGMHVEVIESNRMPRQIEKQIIPKKKPAQSKGVSRKK